MRYDHSFAPDTLTSESKWKTRADRHGRLFSLLRAESSLIRSTDEMSSLRPRAAAELNDAELLDIQTAASRTLVPRSF